MPNEHPVIDGLRRTLETSASSAQFVRELEGRVRQLVADMVDGRVLPKQDADALKRSMIEFVRSEALPKFAGRNPRDALRILDKLRAYGFGQLESEWLELEAARRSKSPPPRPASWPELEELRVAARRDPDACAVAPAVRSVDFAIELEEDGIGLPDELLALYAACDGFDEYEPVAKKKLDLRQLLRFGLARMNAPTAEALDADLSWELFFDTT